MGGFPLYTLNLGYFALFGEWGGEGREGGVFWGMFFCFGFFLGGEVLGVFLSVLCVCVFRRKIHFCCVVATCVLSLAVLTRDPSSFAHVLGWDYHQNVQELLAEMVDVPVLDVPQDIQAEEYLIERVIPTTGRIEFNNDAPD